MFCPKCGNADQNENTFCRQCGTFLPDFDKIQSKETLPEEHLKANAALNLMSAIVSLTLAVLLYSFFLGRDNTPVLIYITAGFLTAMFFWQVQTFWRTLLVKKQLPKRNKKRPETERQFLAAKTKELLPEADLSNTVPASVTENTTNLLHEKARRKIKQEPS